MKTFQKILVLAISMVPFTSFANSFDCNPISKLGGKEIWANGSVECNRPKQQRAMLEDEDQTDQNAPQEKDQQDNSAQDNYRTTSKN